MGAIVIKSKNNKNLKLLTALAKQLGETVIKLSATQAEDLQLGIIMEREKTGKTVSPKAVLKHILLEEYNKELDASEAEIDNGEFYTQDEVKEISKTWIQGK